MLMRPAPDPAAALDAAAQRPSKTQLKQQMHELQRLGQALTDLPTSRLDALALPDRLRDAIAEFKRTRSHEGRRRQLQFIGKLMRGADVEPLRSAVAAERLGPAEEALQLHEAERWRLELVNDIDAIERWFAAHPGSDGQRLRALVLAARRDAGLPPERRHGRAWRDLFRFVKLHLTASSR